MNELLIFEIVFTSIVFFRHPFPTTLSGPMATNRSRRGGARSPCWWQEGAPKWVFTRLKRTGLVAVWTFSTWTMTTGRLTMRESLVRGDVLICVCNVVCILVFTRTLHLYKWPTVVRARALGYIDCH